MQRTMRERGVVASDWRYAVLLVMGIIICGGALFNILLLSSDLFETRHSFQQLTSFLSRVLILSRY